MDKSILNFWVWGTGIGGLAVFVAAMNGMAADPLVLQALVGLSSSFSAIAVEAVKGGGRG